MSHTGLSIPELEATYDVLAEAIDAAGAEKANLFLVKLVLLQANAMGDVSGFREQVLAALRDL